MHIYRYIVMCPRETMSRIPGRNS